MIPMEESIKYMDPNGPANPRYESIVTLNNELAGYVSSLKNYLFRRDFDGWHLILSVKDKNDNDVTYISVIEHAYSFLSEYDKVELWTKELENAGSDPIAVSKDEALAIINYILCVDDRYFIEEEDES